MLGLKGRQDIAGVKPLKLNKIYKPQRGERVFCFS